MTKTLIVADTNDVDNAALADAATERGWAVAFVADTGLDPTRTLVYGTPDFCRTIADAVGLELHAPDPQTLALLPATLRNLSTDNLQAEGRAFISDGRVLTATIYEGEAEMMEAAVFAGSVAWDYAPDFAFVIDVGFDPDFGWSVLALRPVWSAEIYDCDPATVLDCLENAIDPR